MEWDKKHKNWEYECDEYAQKEAWRIREINAMEIAFGNMIEKDNKESQLNW
jgi:hypothetical protein